MAQLSPSLFFIVSQILHLSHQTDDSTNEDYDLNDKNDNHKVNNHTPVRKSERLRKRLVDIDPEDIGENDNEKDKDYKI